MKEAKLWRKFFRSQIQMYIKPRPWYIPKPIYLWMIKTILQTNLWQDNKNKIK